MTAITIDHSALPQVRLDQYDQSWYSRGRSALLVVLWDIAQSLLIHGSLLPMYGFRRFVYRLFGARVGKDVLIRRTVTCNYPWKLSIGDHSWIGDDVKLYCLDHISIGQHVVISQQAYLCTGTHDHHDPAFGLVVRPIVIENDVWVALGATVMPGVHIGAGALIGARAFLTRNADPWTDLCRIAGAIHWKKNPESREGMRRMVKLIFLIGVLVQVVWFSHDFLEFTLWAPGCIICAAGFLLDRRHFLSGNMLFWTVSILLYLLSLLASSTRSTITS